MTRSCHHCDEFSRASLLRRGAAEAGRGLPAIEPGMPAPAGTGLDRRSFVSGALGLALSVYGLGKLRLFEDGIAQAASGPGAAGARLRLPARRRRLALGALPRARPELPQAAPDLALPDSAGPVFAEDNRLHWHPKLQPLATLHGEGKVSVMPAIGYTHPDQSHFTSRHFWEVGATDARLASGWMGRYLDHHGTKDNPLQGLSLDYQLQPALASTKVPVASLAAPDEYTFGAPGVWGEVENRMLETLGALGAHRSDPFLNQAAKAVAQSDRLRRQLGAVRQEQRHRLRQPRHLSGRRQRLPAPARRPRGDARGEPAAALRRADRARRVRHALRPAAGARRRPRHHARTLLAFQRDLEARGLADRVLDARLVGVRPARRGERQRRHRPRRRRHGVPDRRPRARPAWSASSPASRTASTTTAT